MLINNLDLSRTVFIKMESGDSTGSPYVTFNNGHKFPAIGLGTFLSSEGDCRQVVYDAIVNHGYRHIDTASIYQNEEAVGDAIQQAIATGKVKREDIFVTTKLWQDEREDVEGALRRSLKKLKLDYVDLYLIHWMAPKLVWEDGKDFIKNTPTHKVWAELERLVDGGLAKSIGVSNCNTTMLIDLWSYARIKPVANQIELHPYLTQKELVAFHEKLGVKLIAYAPLGANAWSIRDEKLKDLNLLEEPVIKGLAAKYNKKVGQIILNWHLKARGHLVIPKTTKVERLPENFQVFDFNLTDDEYKTISNLDRNARLYNPKFMDGFGWNLMPYFD